jgi:hypothetical protein
MEYIWSDARVSQRAEGMHGYEVPLSAMSFRDLPLSDLPPNQSLHVGFAGMQEVEANGTVVMRLTPSPQPVQHE